MAITAFRTLFLSLMFAATLAGCSYQGDFGQTEPSFFEDKMLPATKSLIGRVNSKLGRGNAKRTSSLTLSEGEEQLRSLARQLADPHERASVRKTLSRQADAAGVRKNKYELNRRKRHRAGVESRKYKSPFRSRSALFYAIGHDIDLTRNLTSVVQNVYQQDRIRHRRLNAAHNVGRKNARDIKLRIKENLRIVRTTLLVLRNRISDYRLDLRNMKLQNPGLLEYEIGQQITRLVSAKQSLERRATHWRANRPAPRGQPRSLSSDRYW